MAHGFSNRVWCDTATTGTGNVTIGAARGSHCTPADAGTPNGADRTWLLEEGNDFEIFRGAYTTAGTVVTRGTVLLSQIAGVTGTTRMTLAGAATIRQIAAAEDLLSFGVVRIQKFTASGTYTPDANLLYAVIECYGGGGGGGGVTNVAGQSRVAGGGGAGGYSKKIAAAATIGASQTVTIGAAGTAAAAGTNAGGAGGNTSVGSLCIANGGSGGGAGSTSVAGGLGGTAGTGDVTPTGQNGRSAVGDITANLIIALGGEGASSPMGGGGRGGLSNAGGAAGVAATGFAAGGGGASAQGGAASTAGGGAGSAGIVIITEFCRL